MKSHIFRYLLMLMFVWVEPAFGSPDNWQFKDFSLKDGLPNNTIQCITQDSLEYIWIGTENGLSRFDGVDFRNYYNIPKDSSSLIGNSVRKILVDSKGRLIIGTSDGLCVYDAAHDDFNRSFHVLWITVRDIAEDQDGNIWVATEGRGLLKFSVDFKLIRHYEGKDPQSATMGNNVWKLLHDGDILWIGTQDGRLIELDKRNNTFKQVKEFGNNNGLVTAIQLDRDKNLVVLTEDSGLIKVITKDKKDHAGYSVIRYGKRGHYLYSMIKAPDGEFYLPYSENILAFNSEKGVFHDLFNPSVYAEWNFNFGSLSMFFDRQQNIWLGRMNDGIGLICKPHKFFINNTHPDFRYAAVNQIFENSRHQYIACTQIGTVYQKGQNDPDFRTSTQYNFFIHSPIEANTIFKVIETSPDIYLVATYKGLILYNARNGRTESYFVGDGRKNSVSSSHIYDMIQVDSNNFWLATNGGGIDIFNLKTKKFQYYLNESDPLPGKNLLSNYCLSLLKDHSGKIWIGTYNGLCRYDPQTKKFQSFMNDKNQSGSLCHNWIFCLFEDSENRIWVGTPGGLNLYNPETKSFRSFDKNTGMSDNMICAITEDYHKQLWVSTGNGITRISMADFSCRLYNLEDGLKILQFSRLSVFRNHEGYIFMGGKDGVLSFQSDKIGSNPLAPTVRITALKIFNETVNSRSNPDILPREIILLNKIRIPYDKKVITFEFTAFNYINSSKNSYQYKLEGFDQNWQKIGQKREVTYTNLDPGEYILKVKAANNDGTWNETGTSLEVVILPPWWKNWIFRIGALILIIGLSLGFYFYKIRSLNKQKARLEDLVKKRTKEVEDNNAILIEQTHKLNETNLLLEERQRYIEHQSDELKAYSENLREANELLLEKQKMILLQAEDLQENNLELMKLNATKDKFFSIIAHDLKNPFNALMGFSEILCTEYKKLSDADILDTIQIIHDSSKNIYRLLENLLQWANARTGNMPYLPEVFNPIEIIKANHDLMKEMMKEKGIEYSQDVPDECLVMADRNMLNTVVRNLLGNAIKFTENGKISVSISIEKNCCQISVTDTGVGIPADKLKNIFEIDQNKSAGGTRGERGTGLGLVLCKEFVVKNGGELSVKSAPGAGSTFSFTVPRG